MDAKEQVKTFITLSQLAGHPVIYDILPQTGRFSKAVLANPEIARWFDINFLNKELEANIERIAKNMPEVAEEYEQFTKDFEKITEFQKNELGVLVNEVDESLFYGKTRGIKKKLTLIHEMTQRYDHDAKDLLTRIEKVTEIENIQRVEIIRVKGKYREVGNEYEKIRVKVEEFVPHALEMFKELDDDFVKLETLMNNQMFADAKNFTEEIENRIDSLQENLKDLPSYVYVVSDLLPSKIDKVDELITSLEGDEYALEYCSTSSGSR